MIAQLGRRRVPPHGKAQQLYPQSTSSQGGTSRLCWIVKNQLLLYHLDMLLHITCTKNVQFSSQVNMNIFLKSDSWATPKGLARIPQKKKKLELQVKLSQDLTSKTEDPGSKNRFQGGHAGACAACWFETLGLNSLKSSQFCICLVEWTKVLRNMLPWSCTP